METQLSRQGGWVERRPPLPGTPPAASRVQPAGTQRPPVPPAAHPQRAPATTAPRRSKAESLHLAHRLKQGIAVGAIVAFGGVGLLVAGRLPAASVTHASTASSKVTATSTATSSGSYFSQQSGGSSFGSSSSSSTSSSAVSGSSTS